MKRNVRFFLCFFLFMCGVQSYGFAGDSDAITEISIGTVRTELEKEAVAYVIKHVPKDDIYIEDKTGFTDFSPNIEIQTGGEDTFNGLVAKIQGHKTIMKEVYDSDLESKRTCSECRFSVIPFALGLETDRNMENISLLGEVGYFPVGKSRGGKSRFGLNGPRIGLFIESGYKFETEEGTVDTGGAIDESEEDPDSFLARVKVDMRGRFGVDSDMINFLPSVRGWYDLANSEVYYKVTANVRLNVFKGKPFEFKYEKGSGAPNFNEGEQFSAGMAIVF